MTHPVSVIRDVYIKGRNDRDLNRLQSLLPGMQVGIGEKNSTVGWGGGGWQPPPAGDYALMNNVSIGEEDGK